MVAIVAGQGLGLFNTSLGLLGAGGQLGVARQGRSGEGVYVNASTGNLVVRQQDEWLVGRGPDAGIIRTYNSKGAGTDDNGDNWQLGLSRGIVSASGPLNQLGSTVLYRGEDGVEVTYTNNGVAYVSTSGSGALDTLTNNGFGYWFWQDGDTGAQELYAVTNASTQAARLWAVADRAGQVMMLTYDNASGLLTRVDTANGDYIEIAYETGLTAGGQSKARNIKSITTFYAAAGSDTPSSSIKRVNYTYDDLNRLKEVIVDLSPGDLDHTTGSTYTTTYTYDGSSKRIATLTQSDDSKLAFTYEGDKVKTITEVHGSDTSRVTTFTYDTAAGKVTIKDALGQETELLYETAAGVNNQQLRQITQPAVNGTRPTIAYTYDDKGNVTKVVDQNNRETVYRYDTNGNRVYERNYQGNVVERVYSGSNLLLQETSFIVRDPDGEGVLVHSGGLTQRYVYDDAGNLRFVLSPTGNVTEYKYDEYGRRTSELSYPAHTFDVASLNTVRADFTSGPGALGTLPAGFAVTGGKLQITSTRQSNSVWPGASTAHQPLGTTWKAEITLPATNANAYLLLQAGVEAGTQGSADYRRHFVQVSNGYFYTDVYNGTTVLPQRQFGPVKAGATYVLEILTSADGGTTLYIYEKGQERSTGFVDTRLLTTWRIDETGLKTARFAIQGHSGPSSATSTAGSTVSILVDNLTTDTKAVTALEQWASSKQASVQRTNYGYDVRGQLDKITRFGSVDANGAGVSDGTQAVTHYVYDQAGNLLKKIDGRAEQIATSDSAWAQQARQAFGYAQNVAELTETQKGELRNKFTATYTYDGLNRIVLSTDPASGMTTVTAHADGDRQTFTLLNGLITTSTYDRAGRLLSVAQLDADSSLSLGTTTYTYDKLGRLSSVSYPTGVKRYFVYDALGRKVGEIDGEGALTEYHYDAAGQVTRTTAYANKVSATMIAALLEGKATLSQNLLDSSLNTTTWTKAGNAVDATPANLLAGESSRTIEQAAGGAAGESSLSSAYVDVQSGKRYEVSAYTGATNATATLKVEFYNGTTLLSPVQVLGSNAAEKAGGAALADYKRLQGFVTAPAGATRMRVIVVKSTSTNAAAASRLTITRPVVALAEGAQTAASLLDLRPARSAANDRISWSIYDDAGQLSKTIVATSVGNPVYLFGAVVEYRYDGAGRLLDTLQYDMQLIYTDMNKLAAPGAQIKSGGDGLISVTSPTGVTSTVTLTRDADDDRRTRYFYDANGRQVGVVDAQNYYTESQYDNAGRLVRTTRYATALSQAVAESATEVSQAYITAQLSQDVLGGQDQSTYYFYNAAGQLKATVDAEQYVTAFEYDAAGNKFKETRYAQPAATASGTGRILLGTAPASKGVAASTYYAQPSANDRATTYQYDGNHRLIRTEVQPTGLVSTFKYDEAGNLIKTVAALGQSEERSTQKYYDKLGRVIYELSGEGSLKLAQATTTAQQQAVWNEYATRYEYAANGGHLIAKITPNGSNGDGLKTVYYYDDAGRVTHSVNALGEVQGYVYNAFGDVTEQRRYAKRLANAASYGGGLKSAVATVMGNLVHTDDALVANTYSRQGLLLKRLDEEGMLVETSYNTFGERGHTQWSDTLGVQYSMYTYDRRGQLQTQEDYGSAGSTRWNYTIYDAFGRVKTSYDRNGAMRDHYYDRLGRDLYVEQPNNPDIFVTLKHDAFGRITTFTDAQSRNTTYTYNDAAGTMTVTVGGVSTTTTYDRLGQTVQVSDGRGNLTKYEYDKDGRLKSSGIFTSTGTAVVGTASSTVYDKAGRVSQTTDEQGVTTTVKYDAANRVIERIVDEGGLNLTSLYRYDALGNAAWSRDAAGVWTHTTFNRRGQPLVISVDPTQVPTGTVTEANPFGLAANPAGANALNQRTRFEYNADGSVLRVTKGFESSRPEVTEYRYDDLGRRAREIVNPGGLNIETTYTYDNNDQVVARTDALGRVTRYVYNASGQVTHVIDATGAVVRTDYDVHGRVSRTVAYAVAISAASLTSLQMSEAQINALLPATPGMPGTSDQVTYSVYNVLGQLTWSVDAMGYATQREYDKSGNVARVTRYKNKPALPADNSHADGQPTYAAPVWSPASQADDKVVDQYVYDEANRLSWHVDAMGYATQTQYSDGGRTTTVTRYGKALVYPGTQTLLTLGTQAPKVLTAVPSPVTEPYVLADSAQDQKTITKLDAAGRVSTVQDALGNITLTEYDAAGRVKLLTVASNDALQASKTQYVYDAAGRLVQDTRGHGSADASTTRYVLDATGQRTAIIDPRGIELAETDSDWAKAIRKDKGGAYVNSSNEAKPYTELSDAQKTALRDLYTTRQAFDAAGRLQTSTNPLGGITTTEYDKAGNVVKVTAPDGGVGYFAYDANNKATWHIDPMGYATQTVYNALGQVEKVVRYDDKVKGTIVVGQEPKVYANQAAVPNGVTFYQLETTGKDAITLIEHDKLGRQTRITDAENKVEVIAYDGYGNKESFTNKLGGVYEYTYDKLGQVLTEKAPVKVKQYNSNGTLKTNPADGSTLWNVVTRFEYDARGNVKLKVEAQGLDEQRTTTYTYDLLDRLKTTTGEAMTVYSAVTGTETPNQAPMEERWYDKRGNLIEVKAADGGRTLSYWDALNRKVAEVSPTGTLTHWDYADDGKVVAQRIFGDVKTIEVNARGGTRPAAVDANNVRETLYAYDRVTDQASGQNYWVTKTTAKNITTGSRAVSGAYSVSTGDVTTVQLLDRMGNVVKETDGRGHDTYSYYDKLGNRTLQVDAERYVTQWTYDEAGNLASQTRYAKALPESTVVNLASAQATLLAAVPTPTDKRVTEYAYDRMNRRTEERVLNVEYSEINTGNGNLTHKTGPVTTKYEYNALGSVTVKTDALSQVTTMAYDTQGRLTQTRAPGFIDWEGQMAYPTSDIEYNGLGLEKRVIQRGKDNDTETDDRITVYTYGKNGVRTSETDPAGNTISYAYDVMGRVTRRDINRKDADGTVNNDRLTVRYDLAGQQTEQSTYSKRASDSAYGLLRSEQIGFNTWGEMTLKGENNGAQRKIEYDSAGRIWRSNATDNGAVTVYYYDANGNATLELTSSEYDLSSNTVLPDNSATSLNAVLQGNKANPRFNIYDKLNRLVDSYEPSMNGQSQNASLVSDTETITNVTPQDPFAAGNLKVNALAPQISSGVTVTLGEWETDPTIFTVNASVDLPSESLYGTGTYKIKNTLRTHRYISVSRSWKWVDTTVSKELPYSPGNASFKHELSFPQSRNLWAYSSTTELYFVSTTYGEKLISSVTQTDHSYYYYDNEIGGALPIFVKNTQRYSDGQNIVFDGLGNANSVKVYFKPAGAANWTQTSDMAKLYFGASPVSGKFYTAWPAASGEFDFKYEAFSGAGVKIGGASGRLRVGANPAILSSTPEPRPDLITYTYNHYLNWDLSAAVAFELSVHRKQVYNAYGEQIRQISYKREGNNLVELVTDLSYNALGKLIEKKDPTVSVTLANGFQDLTARPTTRWYYDALGRLIGTKDANSNTNTFSLLSVSPSDQPIIVNEYHADRRLVESIAGNGNYDLVREGVKRNQYDVFGQLRRTANDNWDGVVSITPYATTYGYNANGQLTSIDRPGAADENYEVDSLGNRIATTLAPDANNVRHRETTKYDALGRVLKTTTAFNRSTSYSYEWVAAIAGGGGWRRTTSTADGTLIDDTDTFGRIRWHKDLGQRATTYSYNKAGLLSRQTSLAADGSPPSLVLPNGSGPLVYTGQDISFSYYDNGLLENTLDNNRQTWTQYRYDDRSNRVFEGYARNYGTVTSPSWEYFQYSEATYDDANRLVRIWDAKSDISYEYDAVGNRRRVLSKYHDGAQGGLQTQDYWYAYDNMNRFTTTMGSLNSANGNTRGLSASDASVRIVQGSNGRVIGYDYANQRKSALTARGTESYSYDAEGYLEEVKLNGSRIAWRNNDARGNVTVMEETGSEGITRHTYTYDADNNVKTDKQEFLKNGQVNYKLEAYTENTLLASGALDVAVRKEYKDDGTTENNTVTTDYDYELWDDAKQSKISIKATNPKVPRFWEPGSTTLSYDVNGHIERSFDLAGNRHFYYNTDADGRVLRREEVDAQDRKPSKQNRVAAERSALFYQNYYFFNGKEVGTVSNDPSAVLKDYSQALLTKSEAYYKRNAVASADFDQNYQPIGTNYPGRTGADYTVQIDSVKLDDIALAVWGDASLWYLLAEANGFTKRDETLVQGQRLVIPNKVTNIHNNTQTHRPYDAGQALGDISPTLPDPPPPPKKGCGGLGVIVMIVVAVVATVLTAGALAPVAAGANLFSAGLTALSAGLGVGGIGVGGLLVAGAVGSIASQAVGLATGTIDKFSWSSVAMSAIGSVAGAAAGNLVGTTFGKVGSFGNVVARSMVGNAITQGVGVAAGLQQKFDWRGVAAAGVGAAAGYGVSEMIGRAQFGETWGERLAEGRVGADAWAKIQSDVTGRIVRDTASGIAGGGARSLVYGRRPDWAAISVESFGSALGDAVVGSIAQGERNRAQAKQDARNAQWFTLDPAGLGPDTPTLADLPFNPDAEPVGTSEKDWRKQQDQLKLGELVERKSTEELIKEARDLIKVISDHGAVGRPTRGVSSSGEIDASELYRQGLGDIRERVISSSDAILPTPSVDTSAQPSPVSVSSNPVVGPVVEGPSLGSGAWDGLIDSWRWNSGGQSALGLWDTQQRMNYHAANSAARDVALSKISQARAANDVNAAYEAARQASQQRIENRLATRQTLSKGGFRFSVAVDQSGPPEFYFKKYGVPGADPFDVAEKVARGAGSSSKAVNRLGNVSKVLGPIGVLYGSYSSATNIMNAAPGQRGYTIAQEAGTWIGGWQGASWGMVAGVGAAVALGATPIGWGIFAAGIAGGALGGMAGSNLGAWGAGEFYQGVTTAWRNK